MVYSFKICQKHIAICLAPVVEYITSGDAWDEQDLIERFNEVTTVKVTEPSVTATLAQPVESDDDNSTNPVIYTKFLVYAKSTSFW